MAIALAAFVAVLVVGNRPVVVGGECVLQYVACSLVV
jgi:hypothetical protein